MCASLFLCVCLHLSHPSSLSHAYMHTHSLSERASGIFLEIKCCPRPRRTNLRPSSVVHTGTVCPYGWTCSLRASRRHPSTHWHPQAGPLPACAAFSVVSGGFCGHSALVLWSTASWFCTRLRGPQSAPSPCNSRPGRAHMLHYVTSRLCCVIGPMIKWLLPPCTTPLPPHRLGFFLLSTGVAYEPRCWLAFVLLWYAPCLCICIHIYVYIYIYMYIYIYIHICTYVYIYIHIYIYTYIYKYMYTYIRLYNYIYICMKIYVYKYLYMYTYAYMFW